MCFRFMEHWTKIPTLLHTRLLFCLCNHVLIIFELIMYAVIFVLVELLIFYCKRLGALSHFVDNKKKFFGCNVWLYRMNQRQKNVAKLVYMYTLCKLNTSIILHYITTKSNRRQSQNKRFKILLHWNILKSGYLIFGTENWLLNFFKLMIVL